MRVCVCPSMRASVCPVLNAVFSTIARPILTKVGVWLDTPCRSTNLKNQDDQSLAASYKKKLPVCHYFSPSRPFLSSRLADLDQTGQEGGCYLCLYEYWKSRWLVTWSGFHIIKKAFRVFFQHFYHLFLSNRLADVDHTWQEGEYY